MPGPAAIRPADGRAPDSRCRDAGDVKAAVCPAPRSVVADSRHMRVMAGLVVPAIHALLGAKTWMPGTTRSPSRMRDGVPCHNRKCFMPKKNNSPQWVESFPCKRGKSRGDGAVAAVVADDMPLQAALSNPGWLGRCTSVLDDIGQARDIRLAGNAEA